MSSRPGSSTGARPSAASREASIGRAASRAASPEETRAQSAKDAMEALFDMSSLLNTGLDRQTLALCVSMIEDGANPEALANVIRELRREAEARNSTVGR